MAWRSPLGHVEKRLKPLRGESKKKIAIGASDAARARHQTGKKY